MNTEQYTKLLKNIIYVSGTKLEPNMTTLVIWNNEEHLNGWLSRTSNSNISDVRIVTVDSSSLPQIKPSDEYKDLGMAMVALVFSNNDDYSDMDLVYYLTVKP